MKYTLFTFAILLTALTLPALAGYDISTKNILNVSTMTVDETTENDYIQVMQISNTSTGVGTSEKLPLAHLVPLVEDLTAATTLTSADCGKTFLLNAGTEFATTLPAPTANCRMKFVVKAAPASASYTVVTASSGNVLIGGVNELEVDTNDDGPYDADADTITFVDGTAVVGDYVEMISDGTSWYLNGQANADGGITLTKAS